jgi:hypothetical protein
VTFIVKSAPNDLRPGGSTQGEANIGKTVRLAQARRANRLRTSLKFPSFDPGFDLRNRLLMSPKYGDFAFNEWALCIVAEV